jgi:DNA polymerase delta subunit 4
MSPKSTNLSSKRQDPLKQGTLSFATVKRVGSNNATSKSKSLKPTKPAPAPKSSSSVENTSSEDNDDVDLFLSENEDEDEIQDPPDSDATEDHKKPTRAQTNKLTAVRKSAQEQKAVASASANLGTIPLKASKARPDDISKTAPGSSAQEKPELNVKDRKWNKHYAEVKEKMGHLPPVHPENQNKIHEILRVFDLSYEFGPCVGIPRLERWERAQALGLKPPKEVYDILNTKQGSTLDEYSQSVFHGEVV